MPSSPRLTEAERQQILDLHAEGLSCNVIAKRVARSRDAVSRAVRQAGGSFDRSQTQAAVRSKQIDNQARRAQLERDLLDDASRLREQLWQPHTYFDWGGKDHEYDQRTMPEPTATDKRNLIQAASTALTAAARIAAIDADATQVAAVDEWINHMTAGPSQ